MFAVLFLLLAVLPFIELALLIRLYQATDLFTTLAFVILTGVVGAALAKWQGFEVWQRIRSRLAEGKPPTTELLDGLIILVAGALLIAPGVLTDLVGVLLLIPPVRIFLRNRLARRLIPPGVMEFHSFAASQFSKQRPSDEIEAEYTVEREDKPPEAPRLPKHTD